MVSRRDLRRSWELSAVVGCVRPCSAASSPDVHIRGHRSYSCCELRVKSRCGSLDVHVQGLLGCFRDLQWWPLSSVSPTEITPLYWTDYRNILPLFPPEDTVRKPEYLPQRPDIERVSGRSIIACFWVCCFAYKVLTTAEQIELSETNCVTPYLH